MSEWTIGAVLHAVAAAVPDRVMTICGARHSTLAESAQRTGRLANFLAGDGLGAHTERAKLRSLHCGQDRVALLMRNDLHVDAAIGCVKARAVAANINYHYAPDKVAELLYYLKPRAVICHRRLRRDLAYRRSRTVDLRRAWALIQPAQQS